MKRCFVMFIFLIMMLILAALTENTRGLIVEDKFVERELATENEPLNELVSDNGFKN